MKILLLHPASDNILSSYFWSESLGLGYIAAVLRRDGHDVEILDAQLGGLNPSDTVEQVLRRDFDCLGITATHNHKNVLKYIVQSVRQKRGDAIISAGGYLPTLSTEDLFEAYPEIDFVVRGEGEVSAPDVFGRISRGEDWRPALGIAYPLDGKTIVNPIPQSITDLDSIPFPARDALVASGIRAPERIARVAGNRGCYYRCTFCCSQRFQKESGSNTPRARSAKNIVDEMEHVIETTSVKQFRFIDDDFIGPGAKSRARVIQFVDELKSRNLGATFAMMCRADEAQEDLLRMLKDVGLAEVFVGVESGSQTQLDRYNKQVTVEQNRQAIETVRRCGLNLRCGFIAFDPHVTIPELLENMAFITETKIDRVGSRIVALPIASKVRLFPGVPMIGQLKNDGLLKETGIKADYKFKHRSVRVLVAIGRALLSLSLSIAKLRHSSADV